jgi:hypothetical protein
MHYYCHAGARGTLLVSAASLIAGCRSVVACRMSAAPKQQTLVDRSSDERIERSHARFGRARPVIAIVGENSGTELTDYVIPCGILRQADVGEIVTVATRSGPMTMRPALRLQPQETTADFHARFQEGADYVVVPAVVRRDDPALLGWIREQAAKGGTLVAGYVDEQTCVAFQRQLGINPTTHRARLSGHS